MTTKEKADIVRKACIEAFNMTYKEFLVRMEIEDNYYAKEKFEFMKRDFSRYFCGLDYENSARFMEGL